MTSPETQADDIPETQADDISEQATASDEVSEEPKQKLALEVKVDQRGACERHITVTIPRDDIERFYQDAFDELTPKAEVHGFRPGRAPRKLVEQRFRDQISEQVKGSLLMQSLQQVSEEHEFSAISEPDFDFEAVTIPKDGPMTFEFNLEVRPEFDLPNWKGLRLEKLIRQYEDTDIDRQLQRLLARYGQLVPHEGAVEPGDHVTLNATVRHEGQVVSIITEQTVCVRPTLSFRDGRLEGFETLMVGANADEKRTATVKISEDAPNEELRGKDVEVELEILDVKRLELPKLTHEFLERIGGFQDEAELRDAIRQELERQLAYHRNSRIRQHISALLTQSANWELPPALLRRQAQRELDRAVMELQSSGFSDEVIRAHENELRQNSMASTARSLKEHFILERIAEEESIDDKPQDYDREIALIAQQQGDSTRRVRARLEKRGLMDTLRNQIIERKVVDLITAHAQFTEVTLDLPADDTEAVDIALSGGSRSEIPNAKHGGESEELRAPAQRP